LAASYAAACNSGNLAAPVDGGADAPSEAGPDASPADAGPSDAPEASAPHDAGHPLPTGPLVPYTSDLFVYAVTSDGQIIYGQNQMLMAVSAAGGAPVSIVQATPTNVSVFGSTLVLPFCAPWDGGASAPLCTWSRKTGLVTLTTAATTSWAATADGSTVAYVTTAGAQPALIESSADGSNPKTLATGPNVGGTLSFGSDGTLFVSMLTYDDGGQHQALTIYPPTGTPWTTPTEAAWAASPDGQWLLEFASDGSLQIRKTLGGTPTTVDTGVFPSQAAGFDPGSTEVVYWKGTGLRVLTLATQTVSDAGAPPCTILDTIALGVVSPDGRYLVCDYNVNPAPWAEPATALLVDLKTGASVLGDPSQGVVFTSDSSYAVLSASTLTGTSIEAFPLPPTTTTPTLSVSLGGASNSLSFALVSSPFVLLNVNGTLTVNDLGGKVPAKTLATNVTSMAASPDGTFAAYVTSTAPGGLFVAPTP
jgi:hypothetical protein